METSTPISDKDAKARLDALRAVDPDFALYVVSLESVIRSLGRLQLTKLGLVFDNTLLLNQRELRQLGAKRKDLTDFIQNLGALGDDGSADT